MAHLAERLQHDCGVQILYMAAGKDTAGILCLAAGRQQAGQLLQQVVPLHSLHSHILAAIPEGSSGSPCRCDGSLGYLVALAPAKHMLLSAAAFVLDPPCFL